MQDPLPLQDYFSAVDAHFAARAAVASTAEALELRATQYRAVQKRLLQRFKDRTPGPLGSLDLLLDETYSQLMHLGAAHLLMLAYL